MKTIRFTVKPMVTQLALIGVASFVARDSFWRDIELFGAPLGRRKHNADYLKRKKGRA